MLGFAWKVTNDNKTVIRGGAGIYYDTINLEIRLEERGMIGPADTARALLGDSVFFPTISQLNGFSQLPGPLQPTALSSEPTTFTGAELVNLIPAFYAGARLSHPAVMGRRVKPVK